MLNRTKARLLIIGVGAAAITLIFEAAKRPLYPSMTLWESHGVTVAFTAMVAVAVGFILQQREERSRRELRFESLARQRAQEESRRESLARGRVEAELQQSEARMRMAIDAARIGFFDWDVIRDQQVWSDTAKQLLGLGQESPADLAALMSAVHPEDRESLRQVIAGVSGDNPEFIHEHRACWPDGSQHWISARGRGFFDGERLVKISGIAMNIEERRQAEEQLRLQATALQEAANAVVLTDDQGIIIWVNPAFTQMTGYSADEAIGKNPRVLKSGKHDAAFYSNLWNTIAQGTVWRGEIINRKKDGSLYTEDMTVAPVRSVAGVVSHFVAIKQDITQRKLAEHALQNAEQKYRSIFENAVLGIFQTTEDGQFLRVNSALAKMFGYSSPEDFLGRFHSTEELYVDLKRRDELRAQLMAQKVLRDFEVAFKTKDGGQRITSINVGLIAEETNVYIEGTVQDITERKAAEARVQFLAYHDALTGLPNRALFEDRLGQALATAHRRGERLAIVWLDLDNFKNVNDSLGHSVGDLLLKQVGERLQECAREEDTVAKMGGDEFAFVLAGATTVSRAGAAAERIRRAIAAEYVIQDHVFNITCSLGISLFPDHGADSEALIKNADIAMYCAKENGRNCFRFFTSELNASAMERMDLQNSLRFALERHELFLMYQPQVEIATGKITGAEALLRWRHPDLGLFAPDKFIPIAEDSGLIVPIGEWVLKTACAQARRWQDAGLPAFPIAVNVSAVQFRQQHFVRNLRRVLDQSGLAPQYLELEITEGVLLSNADKTLATIQELARMGLQLSIDDFGTGYSSLSYLKDLPVSKLKIDRSFIRTMTRNPRDAAITAAVISMGNRLNLKVLAEGVETEEQLAFLRMHECDEIQGYYFSKPLTAEDFAEKLRTTSLLQANISHLLPKIVPAPLESALWLTPVDPPMHPFGSLATISVAGDDLNRYVDGKRFDLKQLHS